MKRNPAIKWKVSEDTQVLLDVALEHDVPDIEKIFDHFDPSTWPQETGEQISLVHQLEYIHDHLDLDDQRLPRDLVNRFRDEYFWEVAVGTIIEEMTRTLWLQYWANFVENEENGMAPEDHRPEPGQDWDDVAPETPSGLYTLVDEALKKLPLRKIFNTWQEDGGGGGAHDWYERFGQDLGFTATGSGGAHYTITIPKKDERVLRQFEHLSAHDFPDAMPEANLEDIEFDYEAFFPPDAKRSERESGFSLRIRNRQFTIIEWEDHVAAGVSELQEGEPQVLRREWSGELVARRNIDGLLHGRHIEDGLIERAERRSIEQEVRRLWRLDRGAAEQLLRDAAQDWTSWHDGHEEWVERVGD